MATGPTLYITEFSAVLTAAAPLAAFPAFGTQAVVVGAVDTVAIFGPNTYLVKLVANVDVLFDIGATPMSHCPLVAGVPEFYSVQPGARLAVKQD
jgi:hypothetical protein